MRAARGDGQAHAGVHALSRPAVACRELQHGRDGGMTVDAPDDQIRSIGGRTDGVGPALGLAHLVARLPEHRADGEGE